MPNNDVNSYTKSLKSAALLLFCRFQLHLNLNSNPFKRNPIEIENEVSNKRVQSQVDELDVPVRSTSLDECFWK